MFPIHAPLMEGTEEEHDNWFLWSEGLKASEICRRMTVQCDDNYMKRGKV
jgi:hypothetical protein